ncbi:RluA family pseudouridine synthase [Curtanaerobium respiraculi]|uniref:RluA family pseudouridine synthase n=1 Tax=Curtanaerobium respiraculi TaxID=2949669 RepID=UPI0024B3981A|nr:RluA family pseudouridine synthase [Curtanaerobium respiraculi]
MARSLLVAVPEDAAGMRLDAFLAAQGCYESRSQAAKRIDAGAVFVNGAAAAKKYAVRAGDTIVYEEAEAVEHVPLAGDDIPLDIRYEDRWMLVLSKPAGLCVHPAPNHYGSTLVNALVFRYGRDNLAHVQGDDRPGIVHRLDMDTSGLMMCAKDDDCGNALQELIRVHDVDRRYLTLVHGRVAYDTGMIDEPIARADYDRLRMAISYKPTARNALTTFTALERFDAGPKDQGYTLLECRLYTGRTHQIRVHMEHIGHCCVGDSLYSWGQPAAQMGLQRQFLHSYYLRVTHPMTGEDIELWDGFPHDLQGVLDQLASRSQGRTEAGERILSRLRQSSPCGGFGRGRADRMR